MCTTEIRARLNGNFRPFVLRLSDGRTVPVPSANHIAVGKAVVAVIDDEDISRTIDALHIVSLEENTAS